MRERRRRRRRRRVWAEGDTYRETQNETYMVGIYRKEYVTESTCQKVCIRSIIF